MPLISDGSVGEVVETADLIDEIDWFTANWVFGDLGDNFVVLDRASGTEVARFRRFAPRTEISHTGDRLIQAGGDEVMVIDVALWQAETIEFATDFGRVRGMGLSTLGGDEAIFILDLDQGAVVETFPVGGVSDIHWIDGGTLLIGTRDGVWATVSRDVSQLGELALASLTRGFTSGECEVYGIDPCPTTVEDVLGRYGGSA